MKILIAASLLVVSNFLSSCNSLNADNSQNSLEIRSNNNLPYSAEKSSPNNISKDSTDTKNKVSHLSSEIPIIFSGFFYVEKDGALKSVSIFTLMEPMKEYWDEYKNVDDIRNETAINVDLMSCAGYVTTVRILREGNYNWGVNFPSKIFSKDIMKKLKTCTNSTEKDLYIEVFAIAPTNSARKNGKAIEADTKQIFDLLPKTHSDWIGTSEKFTKPRKRLLLEQHDNWTDLDGDGEVDLVNVDFEDEKQSWGVIFLKIDGKWKVIGKILPA